MRVPLLLATHALISFGVMLSGQWLGQVLGAALAGSVLAVYAALQVVAAGAIVIVAPRTRPVLIVAGCLALTVWGIFCSALASMAATENWM